jgi:hypothetical protein
MVFMVESISAGRASPTHARWKKIGKDLVKLGQENTTKDRDNTG